VKFIDNYAYWITDDFLNFLNDPSNGRLMFYSEEYKNHELSRLWLSNNYNMDSISYTFLFPEDFNSTIELPKGLSHVKEWWISKLKPGDHIPYHYDTFKHSLDNVKRYWMALNDYQQGHIFIYQETHFKDYKKGDLFEFNKPDDWHAACNLGFTNKLTLQFTIIKE
jgi:hypothetical protein